MKDVDKLIRMAARLLAPGGALLLQFREQPKELSPQDSVIKMRAERDRIMQCVLHFEPERVWVTDVVHEWNGQAWLTTKSTYPKLRISAEAVLEIATTAGLNVRFDETLVRQRVLVLTRGDSDKPSIAGRLRAELRALQAARRLRSFCRRHVPARGQRRPRLLRFLTGRRVFHREGARPSRGVRTRRWAGGRRRTTRRTVAS